MASPMSTKLPIIWYNIFLLAKLTSNDYHISEPYGATTRTTTTYLIEQILVNVDLGFSKPEPLTKFGCTRPKPLQI